MIALQYKVFDMSIHAPSMESKQTSQYVFYANKFVLNSQCFPTLSFTCQWAVHFLTADCSAIVGEDFDRSSKYS